MTNNDSEETQVDVEVEETEEESEETTPQPSDREKELEAEIAKLNRQLKQKTKKLEKGDTPKKEPGEFDYGQKAFLKASDIKSDEFGLVQEVMAETGKDLEGVLDSSYFQSVLKEHRAAKEIADAIPQGTKRSAPPARNTAAYWIAKGELPPNTAEFQQLRREVVNGRMKAQTDGSKFTSNPVVK